MSPASRPRAPRGRATPASPLERGRAAFEERAWNDAFLALEAADRTKPLDDLDLDRLALTAALSGRNDAYFAALERLHDLREREGRLAEAARAAIALGMRLQVLGEIGRATAWIARARRLLDRHGVDCVERGYLSVPEGYALLHRGGDPAGALEAARRAAQCGERFGDIELTSWARVIEGHAQIALGRYEAGLGLLDEAMLAATTGGLSPLVTGIVYCAVIGCCRRVYAIERAKEWTAALSDWCEGQPQLVAFHGDCRVHRAEIFELQGAWPEAIAEARRAAQLFTEEPTNPAAGLAHYQQGEILRLRGEFAAAEAAYREANRHGRSPQPGLALLRLAQGRTGDAAAAIRQAVAASADPLARTRFLPAAVEIFLAAGDREAAGEAARDLEAIAASARNEVLDAMAAHARGALLLAHGDAAGALVPLRRAFATWQQVGAPYLAARVRAAITAALVALGDRDGAALEREAAARVFRELAAVPDLERLGAADETPAPFGLTPRELEVLRLVATGRTNRAIAKELFLSEKTVDRHVSNLFAKLDVSTRAAATAVAYRNRLVESPPEVRG